jgi:hypothetical protein
LGEARAQAPGCLFTTKNTKEAQRATAERVLRANFVRLVVRIRLAPLVAKARSSACSAFSAAALIVSIGGEREAERFAAA